MHEVLISACGAIDHVTDEVPVYEFGGVSGPDPDALLIMKLPVHGAPVLDVVTIRFGAG